MILVDLSVLTRLTHPEVAKAFAAVAGAGVVATCGVTDLQLFAGLVDPARLAELAAVRAAAFAWLPTDDVDLRAALGTQQSLLADGGSVPWPNLVVAAVAQRHGAAVLHYDPAFDRVAKVTGQNMAWIVASGTLR